MVLAAIILASVLVTAIISGVVGMAGGMILMAVLVSVVSVASAMIVHGAVQAASNGSRCFFLRRHIVWSILPPYALGAAGVVALFTAAAFVPEPGMVLILVGVFPWLARALPALKGLNVQRPATATACGAVVTAAQLLAGASGPLLDVFYLNTSLDRFQIIASKAFTQTVGHIIKLGYYGFVIGVATDEVAREVPMWVLLAGIALAIVGARVGTWLLKYVDDEQFRRISGWVILGIGAVCIATGVVDLA